MLRKAAVKLYDRQDGEGVKWPTIAEVPFRAGFEVLDKLPDDLKQPLARRVYTGAYDRFLGAAVGGGEGKAPAAAPPPSHVAVFLKASSPRPPR